MYPRGSKGVVAVVFPLADNLKDIQLLAKASTKDQRPLLVVNPQWRTEGQVISDFGFGPWLKAAEDFLSQFETTYSLSEQRIGNPGSLGIRTQDWLNNGGVVR